MRKSIQIVALATSMVLITSCAKRSDITNEISVSASDGDCKISAAKANAGNLTFKIQNEGSQVTEFYILESDETTVVSEAENIGPGLSRDLVVSLSEGDYFLACIPGMQGDGYRVEFSVTGEQAGATAVDPRIDEATKQYKDFAVEQAKTLLAETEKFVTAYKAGDFETAKLLYAPTRMYWERIEPVAESFGDLDPLLDLREADLEPGQTWTGWHKIEKDLWPPATGYTALTSAERNEMADLLVTHTKDLNTRIQNLTFEAFQMGNGAKELLDEVATGKVTGEEEIWSGTDLWDFAANVEGAQKVFTLLQPVVEERDPELAKSLASNFELVFGLLEAQKVGTGYKYYYDLSEAEVRTLADAVDALAEPLSKLTSVVVN